MTASAEEGVAFAADPPSKEASSYSTFSSLSFFRNAPIPMISASLSPSLCSVASGSACPAHAVNRHRKTASNTGKTNAIDGVPHSFSSFPLHLSLRGLNCAYNSILEQRTGSLYLIFLFAGTGYVSDALPGPTKKGCCPGQMICPGNSLMLHSDMTGICGMRPRKPGSLLIWRGSLSLRSCS